MEELLGSDGNNIGVGEISEGLLFPVPVAVDELKKNIHIHFNYLFY